MQLDLIINHSDKWRGLNAIDVRVNPALKAGDFGAFWKKMVGVGSAFLLLRKDLLDQVEQAVNDIGFEYLRFHGILSDDVGLVQQADKGAGEIDEDCLNFTNVDAIYDALADIGIKPFVELSFMPTELASGTTQVFKYPSNVTPPASYPLWGSLVRHLVSHWKERYGADEVRDWYFEVWNEPNLKNFWMGTMNDYFALYDHAARAVKSVDSRFKVGGPASAAGGWIAPFLEHCQAAGAPVDFVSTHVYQVDGPRRAAGELPFAGMRQVIAGARASIDASAFPELKLHVTEWGSTVNPFDAVHDSSNQAAFICKTITTMNGLVDSFSYWTVSDIFEELGLPDRAFHGGFGMNTLHGVHKPAYNAFKLVNRLGREICEVQPAQPGLPKGAEVFATRTASEVRALAWYYVLQGTAPAPEPLKVSLRVMKEAPLDASELDFSVLELGKQKGNAFEAWKAMGSPRNPSPDQIDDLKDSAELGDDDVMTGEASQDEKQMTVNITLEPESVKLIRIFKA
ncbi:MAG: hypothetical protein Q6373_003225 [Candidatus Sigynarchaeota archaeon]